MTRMILVSYFCIEIVQNWLFSIKPKLYPHCFKMILKAVLFLCDDGSTNLQVVFVSIHISI